MFQIFRALFWGGLYHQSGLSTGFFDRARLISRNTVFGEVLPAENVATWLFYLKV